MAKGHLKQISIVFALLALATNLLLTACTSNPPNTGTTQSTSTSTASPGITPVQPGNYPPPDWWRPCIPSKVITEFINGANRQVCTAWDQSQPAAQCDSVNYQKFTRTTAMPLLSWRGLDVCGPRPDWTSTPDHYTEFASGGSVEQEFECTELVKRYLLLAFGLPSLGGTNGDQIVDNYTNTTLVPGTPFHKVVNDAAHNGLIHMFPAIGDVLSYSTIHTSIVTNVTDPNSDNGSATITVIEQNGSQTGTEPLHMTGWIIGNSVSSWMTPRPVPSLPQQPTPTPSPASVFAGGTWQGQGTYYNGQSGFDMRLKVTVNGNTFSGTLEENTYNSTVAISGNITSSSGNSVEITFTDYATVSGGQIQLNCTYNATVSNGQMRGVWYYPGDTSPDGAIELNQLS
jgi:hypothetical protein